MKKSINCFVSGRVQGVSFRMSASKRATSLGVAGWIRNLADGRVEVLASGEDAVLEAFRTWLARGPGMAKVVKLECVAVAYQTYPDFSIR